MERWGVIEKINDTAGEIKIRFDDNKVAFYGYQDLDQLEHAFAITVHKSQGSEFKKGNNSCLSSSTNAFNQKFIIYGND